MRRKRQKKKKKENRISKKHTEIDYENVNVVELLYVSDPYAYVSVSVPVPVLLCFENKKSGTQSTSWIIQFSRVKKEKEKGKAGNEERIFPGR